MSQAHERGTASDSIPTRPADPMRDEREANARFARTDADPRYREPLGRLFGCWGEFNDAHFGGRLAVPHLSIGRTAPRRFGQCRWATNYGGRIDITLSEGVVFATHPAVRRGWPGAGYARFERDLLLAETVKQYVFETHGAAEDGYGGYGPLFAAEATRIGERLGLPPVAARRRGIRGRGLPVAAFWPWAFRPAGYYLGDVILGGRETAGRSPGSTSLRAVTATANEYYLFLLVTERAARLREVLERQVEWDRIERIPARAAAERGPTDARGNAKPVPALPAAWVRWNDDCPARMAEFIAARRAFEVMPILADALEDAGCTDADVLDHCRTPARHSVNCWVLRAIRAAAERSSPPPEAA